MTQLLSNIIKLEYASYSSRGITEKGWLVQIEPQGKFICLWDYLWSKISSSLQVYDIDS